jgi:hypothetical protein
MRQANVVIVWLAWAGIGMVDLLIPIAIAFWPARMPRCMGTVGCCFPPSVFFCPAVLICAYRIPDRQRFA